MNTRREFCRWAGLSAAGAWGTLTASAARGAARGAGKGEAEQPFAVFTKHFLGMDHEHLADVLAKLEISAIEAPIRPGGHVEPRRVKDDLPRFVEVLAKRGIKIAVLASGINAVAREQHAEDVLRTARALGIPRFRMNWYQYDLKRPIWPQLEAIRPALRDLVALSKDVGILPCYQNHSGSHYVGAPVWDMAWLIRDYSAAELAWCFDLMHATIEGGLSWPIELNLARDHMAAAYFKNFAWEGKRPRDVPLEEGVVGKEQVAMLKQSAFSGLVALHVEYLEHLPRDNAYWPRAIAATKRDLAVLRSWWT